MSSRAKERLLFAYNIVSLCALVYDTKLKQEEQYFGSGRDAVKHVENWLFSRRGCFVITLG